MALFVKAIITSIPARARNNNNTFGRRDVKATAVSFKSHRAANMDVLREHPRMSTILCCDWSTAAPSPCYEPDWFYVVTSQLFSLRWLVKFLCDKYSPPRAPHSTLGFTAAHRFQENITAGNARLFFAIYILFSDISHLDTMDCVDFPKVLPNSPRKARGQIQVCF